MADNKKKRGGADRALTHRRVLRSRLLVEEIQDHSARLKAAVAAGHSSKNVTAYLARKK